MATFPRRGEAWLVNVPDAEIIANDDRTGPANAMIFAVNMLVNTEDGDMFTFPQISHWLTDAVFTHVRRLEAPAPSP